ncbi:MAG: alpha/beta hydrolase [Bacteroidales bacterium]|nr:alpha/beta hydrolase [Bacteroidales bacterium]MDD4703130.1 alpha/beta hydrolase [Bacteroidales bacterium]MDX9797434.1 alpha/beta hydrolase [Bacteroidales bacterium]
MKHKSLLYNDSIIVNYQDEGQGSETLVLLHGFMNNIDVWANYAFKFMKEIRVIAIDLLGHGETGDSTEVHTMELQANMVKAVLDHVGVSNCVIAGHSMGGYVALAFAELYPTYVKGLCLINSQALMDTTKAKENRLKTCEFIRDNRASFIVSFIPELFYCENREKLYPEIKDIQDMAMQLKAESIISAQMGMLQRPTRLDVLAEARFPVLFIAGKKDPRIVMENIFAQAMMPYHSEVMMLEDVGHMAHVEQANKVQHRLLSFTHSCYI